MTCKQYSYHCLNASYRNVRVTEHRIYPQSYHQVKRSLAKRIQDFGFRAMAFQENGHSRKRAGTVCDNRDKTVGALTRIPLMRRGQNEFVADRRHDSDLRLFSGLKSGATIELCRVNSNSSSLIGEEPLNSISGQRNKTWTIVL